MKLLVSVAPQALWQSKQAQFVLSQRLSTELSAGLSSTQLADADQLLSDNLTVSQLAALLNQYPEAEFAVAYAAPEQLLGQLLQYGEEPAQAAANWCQQMHALLQLQQQQRKRLKLFNLGFSADNPVQLPAWLQYQTDAHAPDEPDSLYTLLAAQLLRQHSECATILPRLQASSLPFSNIADYCFNLGALQQLAGDTNALDAARATISVLSEDFKLLTNSNSALQQQLAASDEERDLLLLQLQQVQEELESLYHGNNKLQQQYQQLQIDYKEKVHQEISQQQEIVLQSSVKLKQAEEENQLLMLQLQHVQEELENYYFKLKDEQRELDVLKKQCLMQQSEQQKNNHTSTAKDKQQQRELNKLESQLRKTKARAASAEHQIQVLQQELNAVRTSAAWKSTAPVRVLGRMMKKNDKAKQKLQQETALVLTSEYFDLEWYLERYPDVAKGNINPAEHYLKFGAVEGRMPGPLFDGNWYLQRYPDVALSGINPLLHFIKFGQQEGRNVSPKLLTDNSHQVREE